MFRVKNEQVILIIENRRAYLIGKSSQLYSSAFYKYKLQPILINKKVEKLSRIPKAFLNSNVKIENLHLLGNNFVLLNKTIIHINKNDFEPSDSQSQNLEVRLFQDSGLKHLNIPQNSKDTVISM